MAISQVKAAKRGHVFKPYGRLGWAEECTFCLRYQGKEVRAWFALDRGEVPNACAAHAGVESSCRYLNWQLGNGPRLHAEPGWTGRHQSMADLRGELWSVAMAWIGTPHAVIVHQDE